MFDWTRPALRCFADRHEYQLQCRLLAGVLFPVLRELANRAIERLDRIGRVRHTANLFGEVKHRNDVRPLGSPLLGNRRVFRVPDFGKFLQLFFGRRSRRAGVNLLQICRDGLCVLGCHVAKGRANQMHQAQLHAGLRVRRADRFGEARQAVDTANEDVLEASIT